MHFQSWNIVFFIGFVVYMGIRHVFIKRTRGNEKALSRVDTLEKILLIIVMSGGLLFPLLYLFTPWLNFADYHLPVYAPWCGAVIMLVSLWLFWRSHADLGQNWNVTLIVRKNHQLVTQGIYRTIRHPMYLSIWLWSIAQGLMLENWLAGWCSFAAFAPLYFLRTPREEKMMCDVFGQEYRDYMARTGRIFPRVMTHKNG